MSPVRLVTESLDNLVHVSGVLPSDTPEGAGRRVWAELHRPRTGAVFAEELRIWLHHKGGVRCKVLVTADRVTLPDRSTVALPPAVRAAARLAAGPGLAGFAEQDEAA